MPFPLKNRVPTPLTRLLGRPAVEFERGIACLSPAHRKTLIGVKAIKDHAYFANKFFAEHCRCAWNEMHRYLLRIRDAQTAEKLDERKWRLDVVMAPRGSAKSTLMSLIFPIHALLHKQEPYIVLCSATQAQADQKLQNVYSTLRESQLLGEVYHGAIKTLRKSGNSIFINGCRMDFYSSSSEIRGLSHNGYRPTWIILDDIERGERIHDCEYRGRMLDWFNEVIANLGDYYTNITLVGTQLHPQSLPNELSHYPGVFYRRFASVIQEAYNQGLWMQWRGILNNREDEARTDRAYSFYLANKEEMLRGAAVLWPEKTSYYDLMVLRETIGPIAFDKEQQNMPWSDSRLLFSTIPRRTFEYNEETQLLTLSPLRNSPWSTLLPDTPQSILFSQNLTLYGYLDPALGGMDGDFACLVVVGKDEKGLYYLIDARLERCSPSQQIIMVYDLLQRYDFAAFGIEGNGFQAVLGEACNLEQEHRRRSGQKHILPLTLVKHHTSKVDRVTALEPFIRNGWLLFNKDLPREFIKQLDTFPTGDHDDGPDALAACVKLARTTGDPGETVSIKRTPKRNPSY